MGLARRFLDWIAAAALAEEDRWPLWLPVALGLGSAAYFAAASEPPVWAGILALILAVAVTAASFRARMLRVPLALAAMLALGFALAKFREERVAAPVLRQPVIAHLTGRVESLEIRARGVRVVLADPVSGAFGAQAPRRVRVAFAQGDPILVPGAAIGVTASLTAPPAPAEPGAPDYGRADFFAGIGAVGFAYGASYPSLAARPPGVMEKLARGIESLRWRMTARIHAALPGSTGAVASALITGSRGGIDPDDEAALRDAGLAHVLAIAGLHMALVGGGLFWLLRALLAASPTLALAYPIKKWAAAGALALSAFYLVISGAAPSAVRAFVMLACALTAIMIDRPALSMRSLALAAAILIVLRPETVTEPGFQMSFAAVAALVAVAERPVKARYARPWRYLWGIAATSLVAGLATLPFALFYFGRAAHYGVLGNMLAMPVMGLWVMPSAALSVAAMPLGLEAGPLHLLGHGIEAMLTLGRFVSGLPGAVGHVAAWPMAALVLVSLGGLWCALWRRAWRWLGLAPVLAGMIVALLARPPDILIAPDARTVALRDTNGSLAFLRPPRDKYAARLWLTRDGADDLAMPLTQDSCDGWGCIAQTKGGLLAVERRPEALAEDCGRAAILVGGDCAAAQFNAAARNTARFSADATRARRDGGYAIRLAPLRVTSVRQSRGERPWTQ